MSLHESDIRRVVAAYFAAIRAGDAEAWLNTFAPDGVSHDPVGAPAHVGPKGLRKFWDGFTSAFAEADVREDNVFVAANFAAVKWTGRGVGKNGRRVMFEGIDIFEINPQGKIQALRAYWNPTLLMAELMQP